MNLVDKLLIHAKYNLNVLIIGSHGIGKSTIVKSIANSLNYKFKYFSTPTMDPSIHLEGIPVPDLSNGYLRFCRPKDILEAEFIFFDELNRPSHPRILNAIYELIQFKSINGESLPNLKMVWGSINPPDGRYQVEMLDPALVDRFHTYIEMPAAVSVDYLKTVIKERTARILKEWWYECLNDEQRAIVTPRRIEYMGTLIDNGVDWLDALPKGDFEIPFHALINKLQILNQEIVGIDITKEKILFDTPSIFEALVADPRIAPTVASVMGMFNVSELFECRTLLESLTKDLIFSIGGKKFVDWQSELKQLFLKYKVDYRMYPKISEAFDFNNLSDIVNS